MNAVIVGAGAPGGIARGRARSAVLLRKRVVGALFLVGLATPASGQQAPTAVLRLDNDILALRGRGAPPDFDYTHGLHLSFRASPPGRLQSGLALPPCASAPGGEPCLRARLTLGQRIYTPRQDAPTPVAGERPYAGWLYTAAELSIVEALRRRTIGIELGITGPPAMGEPVQNGVHQLLGSKPQQGWAHQLRFEPGIQLRYEESRPVEYSVARLGVIHFGPEWALMLGNVRTAAQVGGILHGGANHAPGAYTRLRAHQEWVARDLFLDGNSFRENSSAERLPFVSEAELGVGYRWTAWALEYRFILRSREYQAQPEVHRYGSLILSRSR